MVVGHLSTSCTPRRVSVSSTPRSPRTQTAAYCATRCVLIEEQLRSFIYSAFRSRVRGPSSDFRQNADDIGAPGGTEGPADRGPRARHRVDFQEAHKIHAISNQTLKLKPSQTIPRSALRTLADDRAREHRGQSRCGVVFQPPSATASSLTK